MPNRPSMRPYQLRLIDDVRERLRRLQSVVLVLPTGGGKTVVASDIIDRTVSKGNRVLFLAHRKELIEQCSAKLDEFGVPHAIIMAGHPRQDLSQPVQVASVQTLVRRIEKLTQPAPTLWGDHQPTWARPFDLIVVDECHHVAAGSYGKVIDGWPQAKVLGLTATPYRLDGKGLGDSFEDLAVGAHVSELIEHSYLVPTQTYAPAPPSGFDQLKTRAGEFRLGDAERLMVGTAPIQEIVDSWMQHARGRVTAGFACTVGHARTLAKAFRDAGVASTAIDGTTDSAERDRALVDLRAGRIEVLWNCMLLTEGWDLPSCSCVILARPTKSRSLWRQMVGRGMRSAPGKEDCIVLDHAGNCGRFGLPDEDDEYSLADEVRDDQPAEAPVAVCADCELAYPISMPACPNCGVLRPKREASIGGGLDEQERMALEMQLVRNAPNRKAVYFDLIDKARMKGYQDGWAAHRFRERFGRYPPRTWLDEYEDGTVIIRTGTHG